MGSCHHMVDQGECLGNVTRDLCHQPVTSIFDPNPESGSEQIQGAANDRGYVGVGVQSFLVAATQRLAQPISDLVVDLIGVAKPHRMTPTGRSIEEQLSDPGVVDDGR